MRESWEADRRVGVDGALRGAGGGGGGGGGEDQGRTDMYTFCDKVAHSECRTHTCTNPYSIPPTCIFYHMQQCWPLTYALLYDVSGTLVASIIHYHHMEF